MRGSVTVQGVGNVPPTVAVTNPPDGAVLSAPATIALAATASDSDGSVANVQFFQGTVPLANVTSIPYSVAVNNLGAGDYTFSAVATDNGGLSATNALVVHVVTPVPVVLSALQQPSPTSFQFNYSADVGLRYVVQRSTDLTNFFTFITNTATSNPMTFLDSVATGPANFYRVGRLPNP
jgi:chitinase